MLRTLGMSLGLVFGAFGALMTTSCTGASAVCAAICECEHCNKYTELAECRSSERSEAVADAYNCGDKYAAVAECTLEMGRCEEKTANYTTQGNGTCIDNPTGSSCMTDAECFGATCTAGQCVERACADSFQSCSVDADCVDEGPDLCEDQQKALADCMDKASGKD